MKIYIVIIVNSKYLIQQQFDSLWYNWCDAAERVNVLNSLYEKDDDFELHSYYLEDFIR